jgi:O-antigen/teichoic acid export membrane protein
LQDTDNISTKINFGSRSFRKYFANTSWLFFEKIIRTLLGAYVVISITNYLGAFQYGLYSYALSYTGIFSVLASLGIDSILSRELIKHPEEKESLLGTSFILKLAGAFFSVVIITVAVIITEDTLITQLMVIIISLSAVFQAFTVIELFFQAFVLSKYPALVKSISFFFTSCIKLFLIFTKAGLIYFAVFTTFEFILMAAGFVIVYSRRKNNVFRWKFNFILAKRLLNDSWPLILSGLVIGVYMYIDQIMITRMLGEKENGSYAAAVKLCEAFYFIPMVLTASLFPAIINAKEKNKALYLSRLQKLYDLLAGIAIAIAVPVSLLSGFIVSILYKPEFMPAAQVLSIYIWAGLATFLGVGSSQYLVAENYTRDAFYRTFAGMVANIGLNFYLIPLYGINGAAFATLVSYSVATFSIYFNGKTREQAVMMFKSLTLINLIKLANKKWQSR